MRRLRTLRELEDLRPAWDVLWRSLESPTPFQSSAWLLPWWEVFGTGEPSTFTFEAEGGLVGLAPFYAAPGRRGTELRLLGAGISDYLDVLVAPGHRPEMADALSSALASASTEWTFCGFDRLRPSSVLWEVQVPAPFVEARSDDEPCPILALPGTGGLAALGTHLAKHVRNARARGARAGTMTIERAGADVLSATLERLYAMHGARWAKAGRAGVLGDPRVRRFHHLAAPRLHASGILRLSTLTIGGRPAAVHYGLRAGATYCSYIGGFDPALAHLGPGMLALAAAVEEAMAEGVSAFDFLGGREAYKYRWGAVDHPRACRHFIRRP